MAGREHQSITKEEVGALSITGITGTGVATLDDVDETESGYGMEGLRPEDLATPFLYVLQQQSKPCTRGAAEYINGAQPGMFLNTSSGRLYDGPIDVVVTHFRKIYVEWVPVDDGGGLVGIWEPDDPFIKDLRAEQGQFCALKVPGGSERYAAEQDTEIVETNEQYALVGPPGFSLEHSEKVIIPYTSIKIGPYKKQWLNIQNQLVYTGKNGPVYAAINWHRWRMQTVFQAKWKPNGAWNVSIALAGGNADQIKSLMRADDPVRKAAKEFAEQIRAGEVKVDYSKAQNDAGSQEEVPF